MLHGVRRTMLRKSQCSPCLTLPQKTDHQEAFYHGMIADFNFDSIKSDLEASDRSMGRLDVGDILTTATKCSSARRPANEKSARTANHGWPPCPQPALTEVEYRW